MFRGHGEAARLAGFTFHYTSDANVVLIEHPELGISAVPLLALEATLRKLLGSSSLCSVGNSKDDDQTRE